MENKSNEKMMMPGMEWSSGVSPELRSAILSRSDLIEVKKGNPVYVAGEVPGGLYHIQKGRLDFYMSDPGLANDLGHCAGPGWWIGDLATLSGGGRRFDMRAGRDCTLLRVTRTALLSVCDDFPEMWRHLAAMTAENMRLTADAVASLRMIDPTARVAACLFRIGLTGPGWINSIPISQTELANVANISRRRVVSALDELDAFGATSRKRLIIDIVPDRLHERMEIVAK